MRLALEEGDQFPAVRSDLRKRKALDWLVEHVEIVDEDGTPIDRADLERPRRRVATMTTIRDETEADENAEEQG